MVIRTWFEPAHEIKEENRLGAEKHILQLEINGIIILLNRIGLK